MAKKQYIIRIHTQPIDPPLGSGDNQISTQVEAWVMDPVEKRCVKTFSVAPNLDVMAASKEAGAQAQAWIEEQGGEVAGW